MPEEPTWDEAMGLASGLGGPQPARLTPLVRAAGCTAAHDVRAPRPIPHYDSSAMDGYVVSGPGPWRLDAVVADGREDHAASGARPLPHGAARPVLTGGLIPEGADGVVRQEYLDVRGGRIRLEAPDSEAARRELSPGRHIRTAGCEAPEGALMVSAGTVLTPAHISYLTVAGFDDVPVAAPPRVTVLTTGDEVISQGVPEPGQVRDSFTPVLPTVLRSLGAEPIAVHRLSDAASALEGALHEAVEVSDLVITTAGTGRSEADSVRRLLTLEAEPVIDGIAMRPGHPTMASRIRSSAGRAVPVAALPGNPLAAMVALRIVVQPAIEAMLGRGPAPSESARLAEPTPPSPSDRLVPGLRGADGVWRTAHSTGAHMLRGLAGSDGLLVLPRAGLAAQDPTPVLDLPW
ncbi:MAG: molybdopterin molybdotransferase MoeA [Nesterenkonia sp.]|nr:molybdopterin molybdotransferase MoeA [Nesterenkonia sp.]